jgi:hypothetical protein
VSPFEYVAVLVSIILGLGITQIVTGLADALHQKNVRFYWPHVLWMLLVFILHVHEWWIFYEMRINTSWQLGQFLFTLLYPINLFVLARLLFPLSWADGQNLKQFYLLHFRKLYWGFISLAALSTITNLAILDAPLLEQLNKMIILVLLLPAVLRKSVPKRAHQVIVSILFVSMLISLILTWNELVIQA